MQSLHTLVSVRPVEHEDFEQWLEYWKAYQAFYEVELSAQTTEATWRRFFDEHEPMHCAVASDGRRLHGIVNFLYHRSTWAGQDVCYLEDLYVSPDVRGQQIGKQLIEYVRGQAEEHRCARLYWHPGNQPQGPAPVRLGGGQARSDRIPHRTLSRASAPPPPHWQKPPFAGERAGSWLRSISSRGSASAPPGHLRRWCGTASKLPRR